nr:hypothetical protein [Desulfobacterales bacterium]
MCLGCERFIESQIFFPDKVLVQTPKDWDLVYEDIFFIPEDGVRLHGWYIPHPKAQSTLLFLHENAGNISHRLENLSLLHRLELATFILDYRGQRKSQGNITEKVFYLDARAALNYPSQK